MIAARQIIIKHSVIIILIFIIGAYLVIKALPENSWDGWRVGSAQALLSDKHWIKNGFLKNYLLFLPQGYSKVIRYFDDQELRQHTHGVATGGFIGKRLYYTHYPSGYLLPTALLMKIGIETRFWFRFLEILFSLGALAILYWIFTMISNRLVAIFGVLYYALSVLFLDYADTLANQPIDELLRFAIIALSIFAIKNQKKYFNYLIWILYFILSLFSYDSTFFIFAWLVGLDLIIARKVYPEQSRRIEWKKWAFWASAPILAFTVQLFQNTLYLGWHNMLLDLYGTFKVQLVGSRNGFFISHLKRLTDPFDWFFGVKWYLGILISILGITAVKFIKKHLPDEIPDLRFLYLGFAAAFFHFLFFPSLFFYQARIISIFGGLLIGILTVNLFKAIHQKNFGYIAVFGIFILVLGLWFIQGKRTYAYLKNWPNNIWPAESIGFDKKIKNLVSGDKIIFQMLGTNREVSGPDRYPAATSEDEYYIGSPILGFTSTADLIRDFNYLKKRSEFPFNAIIIADQEPMIEEIKIKLKTKELVSKIDNKFIIFIHE
ncbi:MAG: hypothetical protein AAB456_03950 [Patescibacteria group bacterium]